MPKNASDKNLVVIVEKIKKFFRKMSNQKDADLNYPDTSPKNSSNDSRVKHLYREDLKMY